MSIIFPFFELLAGTIEDTLPRAVIMAMTQRRDAHAFAVRQRDEFVFYFTGF